jgi:hypothetical protein
LRIEKLIFKSLNYSKLKRGCLGKCLHDIKVFFDKKLRVIVEIKFIYEDKEKEISF